MSRVLFVAAKRHCLHHLSTFVLSSALIASPLGVSASAQSWFSPWGNSWERGRGWDGDRLRRGYRDGARQRRAMQGWRNSPDGQSNAANGAPVGPIVAVVSLADQRIHVYGGDSLLAQSRVLDRHARLSHADRRFQCDSKAPISRVEHLQRRADALDAAHYLVRDRAAWRSGAGISRVARVHSTDL